MVNKFRLFSFLQGINFAVHHLSEEPSHLLIVVFFLSGFFVGSSFVFVIRLSDLLLSFLFSTFVPHRCLLSLLVVWRIDNLL